jgi:hypothetical protein
VRRAIPSPNKPRAAVSNTCSWGRPRPTLVNGGAPVDGSASQTWRFGLILAKATTIEDTMPTFIRTFAKLEEPAEYLSDDFRAVVLFSGIGLVVMLIAVCNGVQGVWL